MLNKINTFLRLLIVGLLIYPMPIGMAAEVTVNENFNDSTFETGLTLTTANNWSIDDYSGTYGTTGNSLYMSGGTYTFEFSSNINVYELGFNVGAVNSSYSVKYYYSDGTDETLSMSAQNSANASTMYDNFYKSFTDYNNNEANTDKFITKFDVVVSDVSLFDTLYWQYDDGLTAGVGAPTNLTTSVNLHTGAITVDWDAPANTYQYSVERYAIGFDKADPPLYAVASGNVGDSNALNTEYTFTKSYLQSVLDAQVGDTLYFKIRSDNDTNATYSSWTTVASYTIPNAPSGVTDVLITNNEYQGLKIGWVQPNTGWGTVSSYTISYKLSSGETYTYIEGIDVNATSYLIEDIQGGTYDFVVYACSSTGWCHGQQSGPTTNYEVLSTTATTTTTTTTTLPPPPPPPPAPEPEPEPEKIVVIMDDGTKAEYTEAQIADGTSDRDKERNANEDKWGCYVTNAALERGDCEAYNESLKTEEEIVDDIIIVEEVIITEEDEILDDKILDDKIIEEDKFLEEEIVDEKFIEETEIPIFEDETLPIDEDVFPTEEIVTDGDLVEDVIEEPIKEETVEDTPIVEETIIDVMEIIEISTDNFDGEEEKQPVLVVKNLSEEQKEAVKVVAVKVTKTEDVQNMSQEERVVASAALGVAEDELEIVAELAEKDESVSKAVAEYVDRASSVEEDVEYTLADAITEVQVEAFLADPLKELTDIDIEEFAENLANFSEIGDDLTEDQREKAQEVVVPVIIASQIIAQAGAVLRRF